MAMKKVRQKLYFPFLFTIVEPNMSCHAGVKVIKHFILFFVGQHDAHSPENIRLARKNIKMTNTLAYFAAASVFKNKRFMALALGSQKHSSLLTAKSFRNRLQCYETVFM
jgi:hypothetical protein